MLIDFIEAISNFRGRRGRLVTTNRLPLIYIYIEKKNVLKICLYLHLRICNVLILDLFVFGYLDL
jgi:hypothetical protein